MVGVTVADIEALVSAACQKAIEVLKSELLKTFLGITERLDTVERQLSAMNHNNDLSARVLDIKGTLDNAGTAAATTDRVEEYLKEIEGTRSDARAAICAANDVEQWSPK